VHDNRSDQLFDGTPIPEAQSLGCRGILLGSQMLVQRFHRLREQPFGFALSFVILPIVLHKPTREQLPGNASAAFAGWVADRGPILAELPDRVLRLVPVTREALLFLIQHKVMSLDAGGLSPGVKTISRSARPLQVTDDVADARSAASLLGRWFASQASAASIMQGLGVSP
jgi:hypothetical protein